MSRLAEALWPLPAGVGLLLAVLALILGALRAQRAGWIVPTPEKTAEEFMGALGARRFQGAADLLSKDLQAQVQAADLQRLADKLRAQHPGFLDYQGIVEAHGLESQEQGEQAQARVRVKLGDRQERALVFRLVKEQGLWKVAALEPLLELAGGE